MILAAPLVIPFAKAINLSIGTLGMAALADKVNDYIEANPEESAMILKTLVPNLGIGEIFMKKGKDEKVEEEVDIEDMDPRDLTDAEKRKIMRDTAKSGGDVREKMKEAYEKFIKPGQDRTFEEAEERYEGGLEDVKKPPFDYKRFFRKADGGAIGVESLFEERTPFRFGGRGYQGGRNTGVSRGGGRSAAMGMGGKQRGGTFSAPTPTGGGGPSGTGSTKKVSPIKKIGSGIDKTLSVISPFVDPTSKLGRGLGLYNLFKKGAQTIGNTLFTPAGAAEMDIEKQLDELRKKKGITGAGGTQKVGTLPRFLAEDYGSYKEFIKPADAVGLVIDEYKESYPELGTTDPNELIERFEKGLADPSMMKVSLPGLTRTTAAKGGRVGFNVGGITDPQALAIYNSMNAYGFSDQEIADTITAQGYDAGTLGQTTITTPTPTTPTTPTPSEGIIGIDLQQRDTGDGFNPFGPLQSTFTKDLSEVEGFDYLTPTQQMNKYKAQTQDTMFGLGRFFQPKIKGTLGNRLQKQFQTGQKLPSVFAKVAGAQSPFNIDSKNYNPDFVDQLNYLELGDDLIGMSSVGLKYGSGSVLAGKNVISGFGTNNYQKALEKFIKDTKSKKRKEQGEIELQKFLDAEKARKEREAKEQLEIQRAATREADRRAGAFDDRVRLDPGGGGTFKEQTAAKERQGVQVAGPGFGRGAYFAEGGLASMFAEKR